MEDCWNLANLDRDQEIPSRSLPTDVNIRCGLRRPTSLWHVTVLDKTKFTSSPRNTKMPRSTTSDSSTSLCCGVPVEHEKEDAEVKITDSDNHEMQEQTMEKAHLLIQIKEEEALKSR